MFYRFIEIWMVSFVNMIKNHTGFFIWMTCLTCLDCTDSGYILLPYDFFNLNYFTYTILTCAEDHGGGGSGPDVKKIKIFKINTVNYWKYASEPLPPSQTKIHVFLAPPPHPQEKKRIRNCSNYNYISKPLSIANLAFLRCELSARSPNVNGNETETLGTPKFQLSF